MPLKRELYKVDWKEYLKCPKCWELKEANTDNFRKKKQLSYWLASVCKECDREYDKNYYWDNKEIIWWRHRWYNKANSDKLKENKKRYYLENRDTLYNNFKESRNKHIKDLWFDRTYFHRKANYYATKNNLKPKCCPICWEECRIELHHPSYESFDKWSEVVFCCKSCHKNIHSWNIECPIPINLLDN